MSLPKTQKVVLIDGVSDDYDVIKYQDFPTPQIESPSDIIIKNKYAGVNFIEGYFRKGYYKTELPYILGREAVGEVVSTGSDVTRFQVGDTVVYQTPSTFAQYSKVPDSLKLISKIPSDTSDEDLQIYGSFTVQSGTAYAFVEDAYNVQANDFVLVWAAAGGVGQILVQVLKLRGAKIIALASTQEKLDLVKGLGAEYTINYKTEDVVKRVHEITNGEGARVSFDSVGKATFNISLNSLAVGGHLLSYGNSSGKLDPIDPYGLPPKNISIARPVVGPFVSLPGRWDYYLDKIVKDWKSGKVKYPTPQVYDLKDYAQVAKLLESGSTTGKFVLKID